jgi:beta-lactamase regulating signal transducer with metallopeptidase domain/biopolymer transport protein ExbD
MIGLLNDLGARWADYFVPALVQNTLFLTLVFIVLHRLRHAAAGVRYAVAAVGLLKLLLPPLFPMSFDLGAAEAVRQAGNVSGAISFIPAGPAAVGVPVTAPEAGLELQGLLFTAWAMVAVLYMAVNLVAAARLALTLQHAERIPEVEGFPESSSIDVYISDRIAVPMILGLFPRRIFVPEAWYGWSDECRRMVLRHEAAHIERRDGIVQALQIVAQAIYFFHPLVMILGRRLGEYREMACDDLSAGSGGCAGVEYSRFLVEIAESIVRTPATCESASTLMKKKNELLNRVRYQLKGGTMVSKRKSTVILAVLLLLVLPLSWYHTSAAPEREERQARSSRERQRGDRERGDREVERSSRPMPQQDPRPAPPAPPDEAAPAAPALEAAPAEPAAPKEPAGSSVFLVVTGKGERVVIDDKEVTWTVVAEELSKIAVVDDKKVVKLKCADDTPMEQIHRIHEVLRAAGLDRIEYRNGTGYGSPLVLPPPDLEERLAGIDEVAKTHCVVSASGGLTVDGKPVEMKDLSGIVAKRIEKVPQLVVILETEKKTLYKDFLGVLNSLKEAGATRIAIREPVAP